MPRRYRWPPNGFPTNADSWWALWSAATFRMAVRRGRTFDDAPDHGAHLGGGHAVALCLSGTAGVAVHPAGDRVLVLRNTAVGVCLDHGRYLRHAQPGDELRRPVYR